MEGLVIRLSGYLRIAGLALIAGGCMLVLWQRSEIDDLTDDNARLRLSVEALTEQTKRTARAAALEAERAAEWRVIAADRDRALAQIKEGDFVNADAPLDPDFANILNRVRPQANSPSLP